MWGKGCKSGDLLLLLSPCCIKAAKTNGEVCISFITFITPLPAITLTSWKISHVPEKRIWRALKIFHSRRLLCAELNGGYCVSSWGWAVLPDNAYLPEGGYITEVLFFRFLPLHYSHTIVTLHRHYTQRTPMLHPRNTLYWHYSYTAYYSHITLTLQPHYPHSTVTL